MTVLTKLTDLVSEIWPDNWKYFKKMVKYLCVIKVSGWRLMVFQAKMSYKVPKSPSNQGLSGEPSRAKIRAKKKHLSKVFFFCKVFFFAACFAPIFIFKKLARYSPVRPRNTFQNQKLTQNKPNTRIFFSDTPIYRGDMVFLVQKVFCTKNGAKRCFAPILDHF